ncbi:MAG: UbiD family decarboxylase [Candidatus Binataceae bacterium]|nr:UbiD family decarboxylase [Candidatus Binataceae bacterium]
MTESSFFDLRTTLNLLERKGELTHVTGEVDWDVELGVVTREVMRRNGPALLFENIKGYHHSGARCTRLAASILGSFRRIALVLGFEEDTPYNTMVEYVLEHNAKLIPPVMVDSGAVQEHVLTGNQINLYDFPVPRWHHLDGGRYIGTMGCVVTKDPDTKRVNVGIYRSMIVDECRMAALLGGTQGWGLIFAKYKERGEPMPVAFVFGWDPIMEFIAGTPVPPEICEYDVMGGYRGAPAPLIKCKTVDLEVPASAEIVIEGSVSPDPATYAMEGPFGEYSGYVADVPAKRPVIQVSAITHRNDPIFRGTLEGALPGTCGENSYLTSIQRAAIARRIMRNAGISGVLQTYVHPITKGTSIVVQIKKQYEGQPKQIAAALWGDRSSMYQNKIVIVVDEDIDPSDYEAVDWAINYRIDPGSDDLVIFRGIVGSALDPGSPPENRLVAELGAGIWNRLLIDATKTWRFPRRAEWNNQKFPPVSTNRPADIERVKSKWSSYRFTNWKTEF